MTAGIKKAVKEIALVALALVLLMAIGLVTRPLALRLGVNFGLHATLAAIFYGALVSAFELRTGHAYPVVIAGFALGLFMGMMSPVMMIAMALPAAAYGILFMLWPRSGRMSQEVRAVVGGTVFAACAYLGVIVGGIAFSAHAPEAADLLFFVMSAALGLLGSLLGTLAAPKKAGESTDAAGD